MHKAAMVAGGRIEAVFYCSHSAEMDCACRKPKAGMYHEISTRYASDLKEVPVVGDSLRDVLSAVAIGATPVLVKTGKGVKTLMAGGLPPNTPVFENLSEAVNHLLTPAS